MSYAARHAGRVEKGQLVLRDSTAWRAAVARHEGRDVWVSVVRQQHIRTMPQNRYYHGVVVDSIAGYIGESREETHELLKERFLPRRRVELLNGEWLEMPPSTRHLSVEAFGEYIERVRVWAATWLHLSIPDANQVEVSL